MKKARVKRSKRRSLRARLKTSVRNWTRGEVILGLCVLVAMVWSSLQKHELDEIRRERLQLRSSLSREESAYERARTEWSRESSHDRIVQRARVELGLVDAEPGERLLVAVPRIPEREDESMMMRFAKGLDRFADVREALAREESR